MFPFRARVLGEDVDVVDMEWPEDDEFGLDLMCERGGKRHRIEARSVELIPPLPDGHLYLAAYPASKRTAGDELVPQLRGAMKARHKETSPAVRRDLPPY